MLQKIFPITILSLVLCLTSCSNQFEKIRKSLDVDTKYEAAEKYYEAEDWVRAQTLYGSLLPLLKGGDKAEMVYFKFAYTHYHTGDNILASYYFNDFASKFTNSDKTEEAHFMSAYSNYAMSPTFRLDQTPSEEAIEGFQRFVNLYPTSERVDECNRLIDNLRQKMEVKAFESATLYYDLREYQSAIHSFKNVLKDYPETNQGEKIRFMIVKSAYKWAENSVEKKQEERYTQTIEHYKTFLERYPDSDNKKEGNTILNDCKKALEKIRS